MTEPHKWAYRHPKYKTAYHVKNWADYDKSLRDRGDITLWISQDAIDAWMAPNSGKRGAQPIYADIAIETALTLRLLFRLPLRQAEGFLGSVLKLGFPQFWSKKQRSFGSVCIYWPLWKTLLAWVGVRDKP
jgi:hypothetical protein